MVIYEKENIFVIIFAHLKFFQIQLLLYFLWFRNDTQSCIYVLVQAKTKQNARTKVIIVITLVFSGISVLQFLKIYLFLNEII